MSDHPLTLTVQADSGDSSLGWATLGDTDAYPYFREHPDLRRRTADYQEQARGGQRDANGCSVGAELARHVPCCLRDHRHGDDLKSVQARGRDRPVRSGRKIRANKHQHR